MCTVTRKSERDLSPHLSQRETNQSPLREGSQQMMPKTGKSRVINIDMLFGNIEVNPKIIS